MSQRPSFNKNNQTNPTAENEELEPRQPAPETLPEGPKKFFKKVVARRTDFCVY